MLYIWKPRSFFLLCCTQHMVSISKGKGWCLQFQPSNLPFCWDTGEKERPNSFSRSPTQYIPPIFHRLSYLPEGLGKVGSWPAHCCREKTRDLLLKKKERMDWGRKFAVFVTHP